MFDCFYLLNLDMFFHSKTWKMNELTGLYRNKTEHRKGNLQMYTDTQVVKSLCHAYILLQYA